MFLFAPQVNAITWQDAIGNTDLGCAGGFFLLEGSGRGSITVATRNTFVFVFENNVFLDFERKGNIKWSDSMETWVYPNYVTRLRLQLGEEEGTVTFDGQNRVLLFGRREEISLSGNYQIRNYTIPVSCAPITEPAP
jgi:hypothetical protein